MVKDAQYYFNKYNGNRAHERARFLGRAPPQYQPHQFRLYQQHQQQQQQQQQYQQQQQQYQQRQQQYYQQQQYQQQYGYHQQHQQQQQYGYHQYQQQQQQQYGFGGSGTVAFASSSGEFAVPSAGPGLVRSPVLAALSSGLDFPPSSVGFVSGSPVSSDFASSPPVSSASPSPSLPDAPFEQLSPRDLATPSPARNSGFASPAVSSGLERHSSPAAPSPPPRFAPVWADLAKGIRPSVPESSGGHQDDSRKTSGGPDAGVVTGRLSEGHVDPPAVSGGYDTREEIDQILIGEGYHSFDNMSNAAVWTKCGPCSTEGHELTILLDPGVRLRMQHTVNGFQSRPKTGPMGCIAAWARANCDFSAPCYSCHSRVTKHIDKHRQVAIMKLPLESAWMGVVRRINLPTKFIFEASHRCNLFPGCLNREHVNLETYRQNCRRRSHHSGTTGCWDALPCLGRNVVHRALTDNERYNGQGY